MAVRVHVFDNLKKMFQGAAQKPSADQQAEAEADEDEEGGSEMMRLDSESGGLGEDQRVFGPLAVLLVGFTPDDLEAVRGLMREMEAEMVKLVPCTAAMMAGTLGAALEADSPAYEQAPLGTRRTVFLSGMYGAEMLDVIGAYKEAGLPPAVFAAAVPNNWVRSVGELVAEVQADNAEMVRRAQEARMRAEQEAEGAAQ